MSVVLPASPLAYEGDRTVQYINKTFPPPNGFSGAPVPCLWTDTAGLDAFLHVSPGTWVSIGGTPGQVETFEVDTGTSPVSPNNDGVIILTGGIGNGIQTVGGTNTITVKMDSPFSDSDFSFSRSDSGDPVILEVANTSNTAASDAKMNIQTAGSSSGDPYVSFGVTGTQFYALGTNNTGGSNALTLRYGASAVTPSSGSTAWTVNSSGVMTFNVDPICDMITINDAPVVGTDGANKAYVDSVAAGFIIKTPGYAATTANLNATYANGAAGVGATLTNAGAMAAFSVDGVSPPINSRILVKDQTTTFENGMYDLTTVGSGAVNWVLTRSTDYDQPVEIQVGDFFLIENGTVNAHTAWIQTAVVTTIGVDPILFSKFSSVAFPITIAEGGTNATSMANTNGINYFDGTRIVTAPALTDGQLLIGNTSDPPTAATLTAGSGINIVNGAGSITISSNGQAGEVVQYQVVQSNTFVTCGNVLPGPLGSIPINTDGNQVLSLAITPTSATNLLVFNVAMNAGCDANIPHVTPAAALFQNGVTNALVSNFAPGLPGAGNVGEIIMKFSQLAGSTSAQTYTVRLGPIVGSAGNAYMNGSSSGAFNAAYFSTLEIWEISV